MSDPAPPTDPPERTETAPARGSALVDAVTGTIFLLLAVAAVVTALGWDRPRGWETAAALVPVVSGTLVGLCALVLLIGALRRGAYAQLLQVVRTPVSTRTRREAGRTVSVFLIIGVYYFLLLRFLPFVVATAAFLLVMFVVYWRGAWWRMLLVSVLGAVVIHVLFSVALGAQLPGL